MFGARQRTRTRTRTRRTRAALVAVAATAGLAACTPGGTVAEAADPEPDTGLIEVGFSQLGTSESAWRTANTESIRSSLTAQRGISLTFEDASQDQAKQIASLRGFIADGVDVIAFSPVVETGWDEVLQEVKDAGIPVVLVDRTIETTVPDAYAAWIGADFLQEGTAAGLWVQRHHPDARIFQLQGTLGSAAQVDREAGFEEIVGGQVIGEASGNFTLTEGRAAMATALETHPDLTMVFAHNDDMALGAAEAIEAAGLVPGQDVLIVSVDGTRAGLQALVDGRFNLVVECNPVFGEQLADLINDVAQGRTVPPRTVVVDQVFDATLTQNDVDHRPF